MCAFLRVKNRGVKLCRVLKNEQNIDGNVLKWYTDSEKKLLMQGMEEF